MSNRTPDIYPVLSYKDAGAGITFLKSALGFESLAEYQVRVGVGVVVLYVDAVSDEAA